MAAGRRVGGSMKLEVWPVGADITGMGAEFVFAGVMVAVHFRCCRVREHIRIGRRKGKRRILDIRVYGDGLDLRACPGVTETSGL